MSPAHSPAPPWARRLAGVAPHAFLALLAAIVWREVLAFEVLGHDSWPLISSGRFEGALGWIQCFRESYLEGAFHSAYYRPVFALSLAVDRILFGIDARGIQTGQLAWAIAAVLAFHALLARLLTAAAGRDAGRTAALVSCVLLVLHPATWDVVPVVARRGALLELLFVSLALRAALSDRAGTRACVAPLVFLALCSKESAYGAVPFVAAAVWLRPGGTRSPRVLVPVALGVSAALLLRVPVVGLEGGTDRFVWSGPSLELLRELAWPRPALAAHPLALPILALGAGLVALGLAARDRRARRVAAAGVAYALVAATIPALKGDVAPWHTMLPLCGALVAVGVTLATGADRIRPLGRAVPALGAAALVVWWGGHSPLVRPSEEWREASERTRAYLARVLDAVDRAVPPAKVFVPGVPVSLEQAGDRPEVEMVAMLSGLAVREFVECARPAVDVHVVGPLGALLEPRSGVLVVIDKRVIDAGGVQGRLHRECVRMNLRGGEARRAVTRCNRALAEGDMDGVADEVARMLRLDGGRAFTSALAAFAVEAGDPTFCRRMLERSAGARPELQLAASDG